MRSYDIREAPGVERRPRFEAAETPESVAVYARNEENIGDI
jgi:hypothetical protein